MTGFAVLLHKELLEQWRTWRMLVVGIIFAVFGIGSPILARYLPEFVKALAGSQLAIQVPTPTITDAILQFQKNLGQTGILAAILLAMGSVAVEKERGTAALLLTKPASRGAFLSAKIAAIGVTLLVGVGIAAIGGYAYTVILFSAPSLVGYLAMCGLVWLSLLTYAALTFLGSTLTRSSMAAAGIGIGGMVLLLLISGLPTIGAWAPANLAAPGQALALGLPAADLPAALATTIALIGIAYVLAWLSFRRQEL
jgi:ABC-2 type transport system permease protein